MQPLPTPPLLPHLTSEAIEKGGIERADPIFITHSMAETSHAPHVRQAPYRKHADIEERSFASTNLLLSTTRALSLGPFHTETYLLSFSFTYTMNSNQSGVNCTNGQLETFIRLFQFLSIYAC